jgi:predicted kinase
MRGAEIVELRSQLPAAIADARMEERRRAGRDASDAGPAVARAMRALADPWPEAVAVGTDVPPAEVVARATGIVLGEA